jgi:hypothetical protein
MNTFCDICDVVEVNTMVSSRCVECVTLCENDIERRRNAGILVGEIDEVELCEMCGTNVLAECDKNVEIQNRRFNCHMPFCCPPIRQFNCHCQSPIDEESLENHRRCYPVCICQQGWLNKQSHELRRKYYLSSSFSRNFIKLLRLTNLDDGEKFTDLIIWIARYANEYKVALDWLTENSTSRKIDEIVRPIYPQILDKWITMGVFDLYVLK